MVHKKIKGRIIINTDKSGQLIKILQQIRGQTFTRNELINWFLVNIDNNRKFSTKFSKVTTGQLIECARKAGVILDLKKITQLEINIPMYEQIKYMQNMTSVNTKSQKKKLTKKDKDKIFYLKTEKNLSLQAISNRYGYCTSKINDIILDYTKKLDKKR